ADVVNVATPPLTLPVPIWAPLSRKLTVPEVGAAPITADTVAVNVTDCPTVAVGLPDASDVVVSTGLTVSVTVFDVDVLNPVWARNTAVIGWLPAASVEVVKVATPPDPTLPVPIS